MSCRAVHANWVCASVGFWCLFELCHAVGKLSGPLLARRRRRSCCVQQCDNHAAVNSSVLATVGRSLSPLWRVFMCVRGSSQNIEIVSAKKKKKEEAGTLPTVAGDSDKQPRPDGDINPKQFALVNKWKDITSTHTQAPQRLTFIRGNEKTSSQTLPA